MGASVPYSPLYEQTGGIKSLEPTLTYCHHHRGGEAPVDLPAPNITTIKFGASVLLCSMAESAPRSKLGHPTTALTQRLPSSDDPSSVSARAYETLHNCPGPSHNGWVSQVAPEPQGLSLVLLVEYLRSGGFVTWFDIGLPLLAPSRTLCRRSPQRSQVRRR